MKVPTVDRLGDIEPDDASVSYSYEPLQVWMSLFDQHIRTLRVYLVTLYGSKESPATEVELAPGASIEIRGKAVLAPMDKTNEPFYIGKPSDSDIQPPRKRTSNISVTLGYWRGEILHFDARSKHEYVDCRDYEMGGMKFPHSLRLLPPTGR
jgi:hypothetical protein